MHSARHSVSDEMKQKGITLEFRNDFFGHKGQGGEGATRYPSPITLKIVLELANKIPVVTGHIPSVSAVDINLLPAEDRVQRPSRKKD